MTPGAGFWVVMRLLDHKNRSADHKRARELRKQSPLPERLLWNALCKLPKQKGLKFRRQCPLHPYVVDFACLRIKLIVELDGPSHDVRQAYDKKRDAFLARNGYTIMRFSNETVKSHLEGVVIMITDQAKTLLQQNIEQDARRLSPSPNPSREGRGT